MAYAAHIAMSFGGTRVSCGPLVKEIDFNEFIVPRAGATSRAAVFHYRESGDSLDFMRIKVRNRGRRARHGRARHDAGAGALADANGRVRLPATPPGPTAADRSI